MYRFIFLGIKTVSERTNLAVCFAFEEREAEAHDKAKQLEEEYAGEFAFVTARAFEA